MQQLRSDTSFASKISALEQQVKPSKDYPNIDVLRAARPVFLDCVLHQSAGLPFGQEI